MEPSSEFAFERDVLADRQGNLRYDHIGECADDRTEQTIQQLLG